MQFKTESIKKFISLTSNKKKQEQCLSLLLGIFPLEYWRFDVGEKYILCNKDFYESHKINIGERKRILSFLEISNISYLSNYEIEDFGNDFGHVIFYDEKIVYKIFIKDRLFQDLMNQIDKTQDILITIEVIEEVDSKQVVISEGIDGIHSLWINPYHQKSLPIQNFTMDFILK